METGLYLLATYPAGWHYWDAVRAKAFSPHRKRGALPTKTCQVGPARDESSRSVPSLRISATQSRTQWRQVNRSSQQTCLGLGRQASALFNYATAAALDNPYFWTMASVATPAVTTARWLLGRVAVAVLAFLEALLG